MRRFDVLALSGLFAVAKEPVALGEVQLRDLRDLATSLGVEDVLLLQKPFVGLVEPENGHTLEDQPVVAEILHDELHDLREERVALGVELLEGLARRGRTQCRDQLVADDQLDHGGVVHLLSERPGRL